ncbi:MAG TPA: erythromycin esterase family protein [Telluria sp.]|nr:erythromycin esterase family protein [Telluria sp.]
MKPPAKLSPIRAASARAVLLLSLAVQPHAVAAQSPAPETKSDFNPANVVRLAAAGGSEFGDLQFLKPVLANKRIVALGESSHGVDEFSALKVRLIKFLHEQMGFNVIALEGPMNACAVANQALDITPDTAARQCLYPVWQTPQGVALYQYVHQRRLTGANLQIVGFDVQDYNLPAEMGDLVRQVLPTETAAAFLRDLAEAEQALSALVRRPYGSTEPTIVPAQYRRLLDRWNAATRADRTNPNVSYVRQQLVSRIARADERASPVGTRAAYDARDEGMARNFDYLARHVYPGEKIIIWSHNAHIAKEWNNPKDVRMMGHWLAKSFGDSMYVAALIMGKGTAADQRRPYQVTAPPAGSLESHFAAAAHPIGFLDLRTAAGTWKAQPVMTRDWGINPVTIIPVNSFDGFFYVDFVTAPLYRHPDDR